MSFFSLIRRLQSKYREQTRSQSGSRAQTRLRLERLEAREMPAASVTPTILSINETSVGPNAGNAQITIQFNEDVIGAGKVTTADPNASTNDVKNFILYASDGSQIPITSISYSATLNPVTNTVSYTATILNSAIDLPNGTGVLNHQLVADTYTLFVEGDQVADAATGKLLLSQPGQVVVANQGQGGGNLSTISFTDGLTINPNGSDAAGAVTNINAAGSSGGTVGEAPVQILMADLDGRTTSTGSPINDLIVLNGDPAINNADTIQIFLGLASGGFESTPNKTLALTQGGDPVQMVLGDFFQGNIGDSGLDGIAVVEKTTSQLFIYDNTSTASTGLNFSSPGLSPLTIEDPKANLLGPVGITVGNFNDDNYLDIAVACSAFDQNSDMDVVFVLGALNGQFQNPDATFAANNTPSDFIPVEYKDANGGIHGLQSAPVAITSGHFYNSRSSKLDDVAVGSDNDVAFLVNTGGTPTLVNFDYPLKSVLIGGFTFDEYAFLEYDNVTSGTLSMTAGNIQVSSTTSIAAPPYDDVLITTKGGLVTLLNEDLGILDALGRRWRNLFQLILKRILTDHLRSHSRMLLFRI